MICVCSLVTQLDNSASAPSRITITLSLDPEDTVAFVTPLLRAIIETITAMTTPMPKIDMAVETRRALRLPMLYRSGIIVSPRA